MLCVRLDNVSNCSFGCCCYVYWAERNEWLTIAPKSTGLLIDLRSKMMNEPRLVWYGKQRTLSDYLEGYSRLRIRHYPDQVPVSTYIATPSPWATFPLWLHNSCSFFSELLVSSPSKAYACVFDTEICCLRIWCQVLIGFGLCGLWTMFQPQCTRWSWFAWFMAWLAAGPLSLVYFNSGCMVV